MLAANGLKKMMQMAQLVKNRVLTQVEVNKSKPNGQKGTGQSVTPKGINGNTWKDNGKN